MRWLNESLNRRFAVGTAAGLLISSLFFLILFVNLFRGQLERERAEAAAQAGRLVATALDDVLLRRDLGGLRSILDNLGGQPGILAVRIGNPEGRIRFSSDPSAVGQDAAVPSVHTGKPVWQLVDDSGGRSVMRSISPLPNREACAGCHGPVDQYPITGYVYVDLDAESLSDKAAATTLLLMGSGALIVLINIAGGWWFIRRYVIQPLERLSETSLRLSRGALDARISLPGEGEFSALAERYNQMAQGLQDKFREIEYKEVFLQSLVDAVPDGIRVIDEDYRVLLANATYRRQHGFGERGDIPEHCFAASHGRDTPCPETLTLCPLKEAIARCEPVRVLHRHRQFGGHELDVEIYAAPMQVQVGGRKRNMVVESIRDLSQEVRFSHEQRLSELGRLAAGVAHEIHNPLASVRMALHAAQQAHLGPEPDAGRVSDYLALVDQEVERCSEVTERLLKLSIPPPRRPELVSVDRVVEETVGLLGWEAEALGVKLELRVDGAPLRVLAADSDLRMMTLNLAQNACHAMPGGGRLTVHCRREGNGIVIRFEDTGIGIAPADQSRIFEPFFSRRADGVRGTGLGLPITKAIVEGHGGSIEVESERGRGSRFTVRFADADADARQGASAALAEA
jgi:signal transduction histidine kinase/HAMP domain-containing protein